MAGAPVVLIEHGRLTLDALTEVLEAERAPLGGVSWADGPVVEDGHVLAEQVARGLFLGLPGEVKVAVDAQQQLPLCLSAADACAAAVRVREALGVQPGWLDAAFAEQVQN